MAETCMVDTLRVTDDMVKFSVCEETFISHLMEGVSSVNAELKPEKKAS